MVPFRGCFQFRYPVASHAWKMDLRCQTLSAGSRVVGPTYCMYLLVGAWVPTKTTPGEPVTQVPGIFYFVISH